MSAWTPSNEQLRKEAFWRTKPKDPTQAFKASGVPYYSRRSVAASSVASAKDGPQRILMPDDFMPLGPHAGKHLRAVPTDYLLWVNAQPWAKNWPHWHPIADYLDRHPELAIVGGGLHGLQSPGAIAERSETDNRRLPEGRGQGLPRQHSDAAPPPASDSETTANGSAATPQPPQTTANAAPPQFYLTPLRSHFAELHCLPTPGHADLLHTFALGAVGLDPSHFWNNPKYVEYPHYRLAQGRFELALHHGAQLIDATTRLAHIRQWRAKLTFHREHSGSDVGTPARNSGSSIQHQESSIQCTCTKHAYTKIEAETALNQRLKSRRHTPDYLRIYECPSCHFWHLTSKQPYEQP